MKWLNVPSASKNEVAKRALGKQKTCPVVAKRALAKSKNEVAKRALVALGKTCPRQAKMKWLNVPSASKNEVAKRALGKQK